MEFKDKEPQTPPEPIGVDQRTGLESSVPYICLQQGAKALIQIIMDNALAVVCNHPFEFYSFLCNRWLVLP